MWYMKSVMLNEKINDLADLMIIKVNHNIFDMKGKKLTIPNISHTLYTYG